MVLEALWPFLGPLLAVFNLSIDFWYPVLRDTDNRSSLCNAGNRRSGGEDTNPLAYLFGMLGKSTQYRNGGL